MLEVFGDLGYTHAYLDEPGGVTLQFETSVAGDGGRRLEVEGVDIFRLDDAGSSTVSRALAALTVMHARQLAAAPTQVAVGAQRSARAACGLRAVLGVSVRVNCRSTIYWSSPSQ